MKLGDYIQLTDTDIEYDTQRLSPFQKQKLLYYHYYGFTARQIAKEIKSCREIVYKYLKKFNLKANKKS